MLVVTLHGEVRRELMYHLEHEVTAFGVINLALGYVGIIHHLTAHEAIFTQSERLEVREIEQIGKTADVAVEV